MRINKGAPAGGTPPSPAASPAHSELCVPRTVLAMLNSEARSAHPEECCGIIWGVGWQLLSITPAPNIHPSPATHFEIDPAALIRAYRRAREGGPDIMGYYHSHPTGCPSPSPTDQAMAARDGKIWAIIGRHEIEFWRDDPGGFKPLSYQLQGG